MKIQYNPPEEKTYISPDHFVATDGKLRLIVIDGKFQFQYYNSVTDSYETQEFNKSQNYGEVDIDDIIGLVNAYQNRNG